uniref:Rad60-SLD domain-containing protein n=2 Tax=Steinernema glaseri TaxID=37863 RepID=A0A1I7ZQ87_9BILA
MDRVPVAFIEEVLLMIDYVSHWVKAGEAKKLSSNWGEMAKRKSSKKEVRLNVYLTNDKEAVFSVTHYYRNVPLVDLDKVIVDNMCVKDGEEAEAEEQYHPLTEANFQLLRRHLSRGNPCTIELECKERQRHPLLQQLCLAPTRLSRIRLFHEMPIPVEALTRSVKRGTLRWFGSDSSLKITPEVHSALLKFVASNQMDHMSFEVQEDSPVSYETLLAGVVYAFLSGQKTEGFHFFVDSDTSEIVAPLREVGMQNNVEFVAARRCYINVFRKERQRRV